MHALAIRTLASALVLGAFAATEVLAQELPLKRELPSGLEGPCSAVFVGDLAGADPSAERRSQASEMMAEASQAAILGDQTRAVRLLGEAGELDPASPVIAYRLGRILEDGGAAREALGPYCRYLALDPDGAEAGDVQDRVHRIARDERLEGPPPVAREAFQAGIEAFDGGAFEEATRFFSRSLAAHPGWPEAHFNRGLAHARAGGAPAAESDLERYLQLRPDAPDGAQVAAAIRGMGVPPAPTHRPAVALVTGMVVPGMGHFYARRPGTGVLVLAAAGAAAGAGILHRTVDVQCRSVLVDGECPPGQVASRTEARPLLVPGLAAAGAITLAGALHAFVAARRGNAGGMVMGSGVPIPVSAPGHTGAVLRLTPGHGRGGGTIRATVEVRF